jgi:hypothetical protein
MEQPHQLAGSAPRDPGRERIVFGPICFTGLGVMIAIHTSRR